MKIQLNNIFFPIIYILFPYLFSIIYNVICTRKSLSIQSSNDMFVNIHNKYCLEINARNNTSSTLEILRKFRDILYNEETSKDTQLLSYDCVIHFSTYTSPVVSSSPRKKKKNK